MKLLISIIALVITTFALSENFNPVPFHSYEPCRDITQKTQNIFPLMLVCTPALKATAKTRGRIRAANYCRRTCGSTGSNKVIKISNKVVRTKNVSGGMCEIVTSMKYHCR